MLDLFTIFTKGGIVLWYFQGTALSLTPAVNALIKSVILQVSASANLDPETKSADLLLDVVQGL